MTDKAKQYFNCTDKERAIFEAGIKLGTIYHQFVGVPLNEDNVEVLEKAIEESVKIQPFVSDAKVRIDRSFITKKKGLYKYLTLTGDMLDVMVTVVYENAKAVCRLKYIADLDYPLMYVEKLIGD